LASSASQNDDAAASAPSRVIRLKLAYDGSEFAGWQVQPARRTVQGVVEAAIEKLTGERIRVLSAGRTDAGVHALGQVASFRTRAAIPGDKWRPALQSHLPPDVVILESDEIGADFHATFSAKSKRYRYVIRNRLVDDPFLRRYAWRIAGELDAARMHEAAQSLLGTHDFRCFESNWPNKATSVRTIQDASVRRIASWPGWSPLPLGSAAPDAEAEFIVLEVEADGFLYNMVRAIVGTLVNIGRGKWDVGIVREIVEGKNRARAGETAPPQGLYLVCVNYER
jgi:tRNA pseudouridine38-40 synthase